MSKHWRPEEACGKKVDRLRARDGDLCWLCSRRIDFAAQPNTALAWSIEHLIARSLGGPDILENLVLCHPGCNRILGSRSLQDKVKLRERRRRKLWKASLCSQGRGKAGGGPTKSSLK